MTGLPKNRQTDAARLAHALALETQVRGVDGQIREQLTTAASGTRSASLDSRVCSCRLSYSQDLSGLHSTHGLPAILRLSGSLTLLTPAHSFLKLGKGTHDVLAIGV